MIALNHAGDRSGHEDTVGMTHAAKMCFLNIWCAIRAYSDKETPLEGVTTTTGASSDNLELVDAEDGRFHDFCARAQSSHAFWAAVALLPLSATLNGK